MKRLHRVAARLVGLNQIASLFLTFCLLSTSTPAAPQTIIAIAQESRVSFAFWLNSKGGLSRLIQGRPRARTQERQAERDAKVARVEIFPKNVTIDLDGRVRFSAIAYDGNDHPLGGVKLKWRAQNLTLARRAGIASDGEFRATTAGSFSISAEANGISAQVAVVVRPGVRRNPNLPPIRTRQVSTRDAAPVRAGSMTPRGVEIAARSSKDKLGSNRSLATAKRSHAVGTSNPAPALVLPNDGWDDTNYWSADDPSNRVGNTPGGALDGGAGSGNFQFAAPIYGLSGRGINISLGASYNSRLWNKAGNQITYDIDRGWPAPGWSLGLGKLLGMGVNNGAMIVDADGTRHSYTGNITFYSYGTSGVLHTTDGSFIDYTYETGTGGAMIWAEARLSNGTYILYGASSGDLYPTFIRDADGNYISITYVNNVGPRIQTIEDTLGRVITFHYDANNLLTAITAPGLDGEPPRTLVRFQYQQLNLAQYANYGFNGSVSAAARDAYPWVMKAIYYPATSTGYWFGDSDSYSSYGMVAKVVEQRDMTFSGAPLNEQGTITQGSITRRETYSYPLTPDNTLTDAPTYGSMINEWTRDGVNFDSATTGYEVNQNSTPRTTTITLPNGLKSTQYSYNYTSLPDSNPLKALDGLVYLDETYVTPGNILQSSTSTWEKGAYDTPRPLRIEKSDERGQKTAAAFSYGNVYNQMIEVRDYDYGGSALLRSTRATYQNSSNYINGHIFNLPLTIEVFDPNNVRVSRTEYQYDGQTLTNAAGVVHHLESHDPYTPTEMVFDCWPNPHNADLEICEERPFNPYKPATDYRGNVTQITTFANAAAEPATIPLVETRRYDITGNMVTASTSCCEQTSFNYTVDMQYARPQSTTRGSASDPYAQVTTVAAYDFNTGLTLSATDANDRETQTEYDHATLRPTKATLPTGAHTHYFYDDVNMEVTTKTYEGPHSPSETVIAGQNVKRLNGNGQVRQEKARGPDNGQNETWDVVDTIYNNLGQVFQQSRPYRAGGGSPVFSTATYDDLGRTKTVTAADGSVTETFYNEPTRPDVASSEPGETTRVRDAWGRERWGRIDASGRLVEVVEPNPNGDGSVTTGGLVTRYVYNTLGNLITINSISGPQVEQTRSFKYDSVGRLIAQKLAETSATIDDAGAYVGVGGPGAHWGDYFRYENAHANLVQRLDARGVKTNYWYFNPEGHTDPGDGTSPDPLGRLQSVSWDTSIANQNLQPTDPNYVLSAATVTYQYRAKGSSSDLMDINQLSSVNAAGVSTESYGYDTEGRVSAKTLTLASRSTFPFETNYSYDALDRVTDVLYPRQYGNGSAPRKMVHHDYDNASRLSGLTYDSQSFASNIIYNAASQTTSLNVGTGTNRITETYNYNVQTGLLDNQTVARGATTLFDLSYDYANASGKRTGQLTKILNNLNHNKDRGYSYDALGRLVQASGGVNGALWTQTYSYDRYGNRTSVTASGYSAKSETTGGTTNTLTASRTQRRSEDMSEALAANSIPHPSQPKVDLPTDLLARNNSIDVPAFLRDETKPLSDSPPTLYTPAAPQSGSSRIAFASNRDGSSQIYLMNTDGTSQTRLTNNASNDDAPRWSPNNSKILFQSDRDNPFCGLFDIYTMNADGSGQMRLTTDINDDSAPVWSPDGTKIAFQSMRNGVKYQVYVMNADGSGQTNISNSAANDTQPSWSPDGTKIAFSSDRDSSSGSSDIYVMNSNGSNQTRLTFTNDPFNDSQPAWSIDGLKLVFTSTRDSTIDTWNETDDFEIPEDDGQVFPRSRLNINKEVYVMNFDGSGQTRLTNTLENDETPTWSGDGSKIVFRSDRERDNYDPVAQIWMMNPDGTAQTNLSNNECGDFCPSWQKPSSNLPPTVSITAPANGGSFSAPANINITANASDSDGTISGVDFYQGATLIGTDSSAPYSVNWNNVAAGNYSLTARATDNSGAANTSGAVNVTVNANGAPTVSITGPANGASFTAPGSINITANASDSDGTVSSVEFYQGTTLLGTDTAAPYTFNWSAVPAGTYSLTAKATDNAGATTTSESVSISVNSAPTPIPRDGHASLSYDTSSNRITTTGFAYDAAGNQVRALIPGDSGLQLFRYDAANRLVQVRADDNNMIIATYSYGSSNERLIAEEGGSRTYYVGEGGSAIAEYVESGGSIIPAWSTSYIYFGARLLSTLTPNGNGGEAIQFHHPDRLGTRLVTDPASGSSFEQVTLPFGAALSAESTGATNRRFTSYDRNMTTGLDYAVNRHYDPQQGRFTQVDPAGMKAASLMSPQTLNLYAYCINDPINHTDPSGLGFFSWLGKIFKKIWKVLVIVAVVVAVLVLTTGFGSALLGVLKSVGSAIWSGIKAAASAIWSAVKSVAHSIYSLFTSEKFPLLAHLQDPLPAAPEGYIWTMVDGMQVLALAGGAPIISATVTVTWTPLLLAASGAGATGTIFGTMAGTSAPTSAAGVEATQGSTNPPQQTAKRCIPTGQADLNFGKTKAGIGPTGGIIVSENLHFYGGVSVGVGLPPQGSASLMVRSGTDVATGLNYSFSAGTIVGFSYSGTLNVSSFGAVWSSLKNGSFMFGGTTPGVGGSITYVTKGLKLPCPQ